MTVTEIVAIVALVVSACTLATNLLKDRRTEVLTSQSVRDKLDYISDTARDTREDVRALDRKLDDHSTRITKLETRLDEHGRKIDKLEQN